MNKNHQFIIDKNQPMFFDIRKKEEKKTINI